MQQGGRLQKSTTTSDFETLNKLGKGSFGTVYKVRRKADKKIYVMKQINISSLNSAHKAAALNEVNILSALDNPYVVKYYDSFVEKNILNIIMEYCEGGDLANHIRGQLGRPLPENKIWKFFVQMCVGLKYIHSKKILHRDIKSLNMFLSKEEDIRIGDLGVAKAMAESANFAHTMVGTPYYLSPEMCEEKPYNEKTDIWALGCVLYEMCTQKHPFDASNQAALLLKILRGKYQPISSGYSADMAELVSLCLCKDYRKRPSADALLNRPSVLMRIKSLSIYTGPESRVSVKTQPDIPIREKTEVTEPPVSKENKFAGLSDKKNIKKDQSNVEIKPIKNEIQRPVTSAKDIGRPSGQERKINDLKGPQNKVESKPENNLMKVFESNNKDPNGNLKDTKKDVSEIQKSKPQLKDKISQESPFVTKAKEIEKPQRVSTPLLKAKPLNPEPQQKLVGKINADPPVIMRPKLLEDKEKPPGPNEFIFASHKKHVSEAKFSQDEINEVKNLPDVVFPTPNKDKSKFDQKSVGGKKADFFGNRKGQKDGHKHSRSDLPSFLPPKVVLDNKPKYPVYSKPQQQQPATIIPSILNKQQQQTVDDDFIEKEFSSSPEKTSPESKKNELKSIIESKISSYESSPVKHNDIPVTQMEDVDELEVTEAEELNDESNNHQADDDESGDEPYEDEEEDDESTEEQKQTDQKKNQTLQDEDEDEDDEDQSGITTTKTTLNQEKEKKSDLFAKLEEAKKKKSNLEILIKERSNTFVKKWGQKAFDELSEFFRAKPGEEGREKSEEEIDEFLNEKLKGDIQPEQVFFVFGKIVPLEQNLEKVNSLISKLTKTL